MFQQGLSGLNAASKSLDVIGNNIANASTVGFKSSQAQFADLYANSLNGVSGNKEKVGRICAGEVAAFQQHRDPIFFCQSRSGVAHGLQIANRFSQ